MLNKLKNWVMEFAAKSLFSYVLDLVMDLILKRIQKYQDALDWEKVRADIQKLIEERIGSIFLQDICMAVVDKIIEVFEHMLNDILSCKRIKDALKRGDFKAAKKIVMEYIKLWVLS